MDYQITLPNGEPMIAEERKNEDIKKNRDRMYALYEAVRKAERSGDDGRED